MPIITQLDNSIKYCRVCDCELILDMNWTYSSQKYNNYICKTCHCKKVHDWRDKNPELSKDSIRRSTKKWIDANPEKAKDCQAKASKKWQGKNPERVKANNKNWQVNNRDKVNRYNFSHRGLGDVLLFDNPFPDDIQVNIHHISDAFVVYIPVKLHRKYFHGKNKQLHRDELKSYIEEIYNITYVIEEGN